MRCIFLGGMVATVLAVPGGIQAQEVRADFAQTLRDIRQGVFLVGSSEVGTGTAWVISRKHRLLATNAHVADFFTRSQPKKMLAMMNGSDQTYVVERVWYHPGVSRYATKDENFSVRSANPKFGEVDPAGPDVAVLQLAEDGPDLPVEMKLAGPKVVFDLQALPTAMLGYPGHDTAGWPKPGRSAQATFHTGVVSRVSDYHFDGGVKPELAQMLQYTMETFNGFSGAPVFLAGGEVIGLHNSIRPIDKTRMVAHGVRVDALWELLVHHKLDEMVPVPLEKDKLLVQRWLEADPNAEKFRTLKKLVDEADRLVYDKLDFAGGIDRCNEALTIYARYAPAYRTRCFAFNNWQFRNNTWDADKRIKYLTLALADAEKYVELHKGKTSRDALLVNVVVLNSLGYVSKLEKYNAAALDVANKILQEKNLSTYELSTALSSRAVALSNLDRTEEARETHARALRIDPDSPILWENRASFMEHNSLPLQAVSDRAVATALRKKDKLLAETQRKELKQISKVEEKLTSDDPADSRGCFRQLWTVELEEGYFYQIDLKNPQFKAAKDFDPILRLADDANRILQEDDDSGGHPNARIFFTPTRTATYKLYVTSFLPAQTGPFVLTVTRIAKDP